MGKKAWIGIFNIVDSLFLSTPTFMTSKILMILIDCAQEGNMEKGLSIILVLTQKNRVKCLFDIFGGLPFIDLGYCV